MRIYEIPCNSDGNKIRVLDSGITGVKVYVEAPCCCPLCVDHPKDVQFIEEHRECGNQEDEYIEERSSDCFE